jgi:hypothetical protein
MWQTYHAWIPRGSGGLILPQKMFEIWSPEMKFPEFWASKFAVKVMLTVLVFEIKERKNAQKVKIWWELYVLPEWHMGFCSIATPPRRYAYDMESKELLTNVSFFWQQVVSEKYQIWKGMRHSIRNQDCIQFWIFQRGTWLKSLVVMDRRDGFLYDAQFAGMRVKVVADVWTTSWLLIASGFWYIYELWRLAKQTSERSECVLNGLWTDVTLDEAHERTSVSWMKIPCSGHVDFPQICGKASVWTVLYLNNIWQMKIIHWLIDN